MALPELPDEELPPVRWLNDEEGKEYFDQQARQLMGMSGEEFLRRWDAGEFDSVVDDPDHHSKLVYLQLLTPFAR
jgi:hypothetical protein